MLGERRVAVRDLEIGMYVCRLDREWEGTPFPLQGVLIESEADVERLAEYSRHVFIDIEMGLAPLEPGNRMCMHLPRDHQPEGARVRPAHTGAARADAAGVDGKAPRARAVRHYERAEVELLRGRIAHVDSVGFDEELPNARAAERRTAEFADRMLDDVRQGRQVSVDAVRDAVEPVVRSILRNADAFLWIDTLRKRGAYEYNHALNCSALAAAFGRYIGFPEDLLIDMASGGLLLDIGKLRVREELIGRDGQLDEREYDEVCRHVEHALDILDGGQTVPGHIREMVHGHHERNNGSGYPDGLAGDGIPLLARIAGVVDSYDAMTSDRRHRKAMSRHDALQVLYRERDRLYAAEVVEQFLQCMGVYPTGSLVELNTGEVATVMGQNMARRLRPRVMVLTGPDKVLLTEFRPFDLMRQAETGGSPVAIAKALAPGAYGLDISELYL